MTTKYIPPRSIRVADADWRRWHAQAAREGKTVSQWLRDLAEAAIERTWGQPPAFAEHADDRSPRP